jgi:hypothetical protein
MLGWLTGFGARRRKRKERKYWALREAQAMRMQHGTNAEKICEEILAVADIPFRKRRFMTLVLKQLPEV